MHTDILFSEQCVPEFVEKTRAIFEENTSKKQNRFGRVLCSSRYEDAPFAFQDTIKTYIVSETPEKHFEKLSENESLEGVHILTFSADCSLIYGSQLSQKLSKILLKKAFLNASQVKSYQLVLQEALSNAIEYGCLNMSGLKDKTINQEEWFEKYRFLIEKRLKDPRFSSKKVTVHCYLHSEYIVTYIDDEGEGFEGFDRPYAGEIGAHGMGRSIIAGLTDKHRYENNGKRLIFQYKAPFIHSNIDFGDGEMTLRKMRNHAKILIVDDQKSNREFAKLYLKSAGYSTLLEADNGQEAVRITTEERPDLVILDILMPDMDGFTVCRKIKMQEETYHIPVLFLSGLDDPESKIQGYRIGAVDYVNKPIDRNELIARTDTHIQSGRMNRTLREYSMRTQKDLTRASRIQDRLLPSESELDIIRHKHDLGVEYIYQACDELAGDYWSIMDISTDEIGIAMADFTGHGVVAALNTVRMHALFQELTALHANPYKFIMALNDKLYNQLDPETFATFCYCVLNTRTGSMKYIGCGAPSMAILPKEGKGDPVMLDCSGLPLGLIPSKDMQLDERCALIAEGDSVLFYSDALIETPHGHKKEMWQEDGLLDVLDSIQKKHLIPTLGDILSKFNKSAVKPLKDDLTLLMLTRSQMQSEETLMEQLTSISKS